MEISDIDFTAVELAIGCTFKNRDYLINALTHSSTKSKDRPSNERLEFLGDAILGMEMSLHIYNEFPEMNEGELTKIKSVVVSREVLADACLDLGIKDQIMVGKGIAQLDFPVSLWANVFEAIIAAIYFDQGVRKVRSFLKKRLYPYIDNVIQEKRGQNFKSMLQHYAQKSMAATPLYTTLRQEGPDHMKSFEVQVVINGRRYQSGWGKSKKEAEQRAAEETLKEIQEFKNSGIQKLD